jgi:hypothetical protein
VLLETSNNKRLIRAFKNNYELEYYLDQIQMYLPEGLPEDLYKVIKESDDFEHFLALKQLTEKYQETLKDLELKDNPFQEILDFNDWAEKFVLKHWGISFKYFL